MAKNAWPSADRRKNIGARISRLDGPVKATGVAKYAYDINRENMLYAKILQSSVAVGTVMEVDTSAAEKMPGVVAVIVNVKKDRQGNPPQISYAGDMIATVAAETEEIATDALKKIKVVYETGVPQMDDKDPSKASGRDMKKDEGLDDDNLSADEKLKQVFADADKVS